MSKEYKRQWRKRVMIEREILLSESSPEEVSNDGTRKVVLSEHEASILELDGPDTSVVECSSEGSDSEQSYRSDIELNEMTNRAEVQHENLNQDLASWASRNALTRLAITELLTILRSHNCGDLPKMQELYCILQEMLMLLKDVVVTIFILASKLKF